MNNREMEYYKNNLRWKCSLISLSAIVIGMIALTSYTRDQAWLFLGFAGTALSIVLSVIAIVITLVDVAGQKQQVVDITNTARELKNIVEAVKTENLQHKKSLESIINNSLFVQIEELKTILKENSKELPPKVQERFQEKFYEMDKNLRLFDKSYINSENRTIFVPTNKNIDIEKLKDILASQKIDVIDIYFDSENNKNGIKVKLANMKIFNSKSLNRNETELIKAQIKSNIDNCF